MYLKMYQMSMDIFYLCDQNHEKGGFLLWEGNTMLTVYTGTHTGSMYTIFQMIMPMSMSELAPIVLLSIPYTFSLQKVLLEKSYNNHGI